MFSKKNLTTGLLLTLAFLSGLALYFYGNTTFNQVLILVQMGILVTLATINGIFCYRSILLVLFLNIVSLIITISFHKAFGVSIVFVNLILACFIFNNVEVDKNVFILIHLIIAVLWTVIAVMSIYGSYTSTDGEWHSYKFLNITYHKNTYALVVLGCAFHWMSILESLKFLQRRITKNLIATPILIVSIVLIINSGCRSAMMAIVVFSLLYFFIKLPLPQKIYYFIITTGIVISGLFTIYYVLNVVELNLGDVMGHTTFNRLDTWKAAFQLIEKYPVFGSGTDIKMSGYDSAHNTVLSILKTIGIIPLLSYVFCFGMQMKNKVRVSNEKRVSQIAIIASLLISAFESFYVESFIGMTFLMMLVEKECEYNTRKSLTNTYTKQQR